MADRNKTCQEDIEKELLSPYTYFLQVKGKQARVKIMRSFNHWLHLPADRLDQLFDILNSIYVSCLLFDDIQDNAKVRGLLPAAHCVYGIPLTMNASMHALLIVLQRASNLNPKACDVIMEDYLAVMRGQGTEIYWRDNFICPTEAQYREMVQLKTGSLFKMAVRLMQLYSKNKTDYSKLVGLIGAYFQIKDDYCNLNHQEGLEELPQSNGDHKAYNDSRYCEDITEGKFSLPIIHAMEAGYQRQIINILRQRTHDIGLKKYCLTLMEMTNSFQYTRGVMAELDREIRTEMTRLGGNPELEAVLDQLLDWQYICNQINQI